MVSEPTGSVWSSPRRYSLSSHLFGLWCGYSFDWAVRRSKSDAKHAKWWGLCGQTESVLCLRRLSCMWNKEFRQIHSACQRRKKQKNKTRICCGTLILITQEVCNLLVQIIILWLLVCLPGNTVHWVLHEHGAFPLLTPSHCIQLFPSHDILVVAWCSSSSSSSHDHEVSCDVML